MNTYWRNCTPGASQLLGENSRHVEFLASRTPPIQPGIKLIRLPLRTLQPKQQCKSFQLDDTIKKNSYVCRAHQCESVTVLDAGDILKVIQDVRPFIGASSKIYTIYIALNHKEMELIRLAVYWDIYRLLPMARSILQRLHCLGWNLLLLFCCGTCFPA